MLTGAIALKVDKVATYLWIRGQVYSIAQIDQLLMKGIREISQNSAWPSVKRQATSLTCLQYWDSIGYKQKGIIMDNKTLERIAKALEELIALVKEDLKPRKKKCK